MAVKNYTVINDTTGVCENVVVWDSTAQPSWAPPAGSSAAEQKPEYNTGTGAVAATNGSNAVTITGAALQTAGVEVGRRIQIGDSGTQFVIASITGQTALTIDQGFDGTTATDAAYSISPIQIGDVIG